VSILDARRLLERAAETIAKSVHGAEFNEGGEA
jgi:hypothetical protein